jgi:hypothetical protein
MLSPYILSNIQISDNQMTSNKIQSVSGSHSARFWLLQIRLFEDSILSATSVQSFAVR